MKFLLVDDHKIVREGLKRILQLHFPSAVIDEASNAEDAFLKFVKSTYQLIITDYSLPGRSGIDLIKQVKEQSSSIPVLILSMHPEEQIALRALKAGAAGYLNKIDSPDEILKAVERVLQGRKYISPKLADLLAEELGHNTDLPHSELSDREFHVFKLLAEGKSTSEISELLSLGLSTVSTHRARILKKLGLKTNAELTRYALTHSLI
jgi:two-component system invasion response regulator UvrY